MKTATVTVGVMLLVFASVGEAVWSAAPAPQLGAKVPQITLTDLEGEQHSLSEYAGKKVVLLQFWATWCPHCRRAIEPMTRLHDDYEKQGLVVLGIIRITDRDPEDQIRKFAATNKLPYDVILLDRDGSVASLYASRGVPDTLVLDGAGTLRSRRGGSRFLSSPEIRHAIETALSSLPGSGFKARSLEEIKRLYPPSTPASPSASRPTARVAAAAGSGALPPLEQAFIHLQLGSAYLNIGDHLKAAGLQDQGYYKLALAELQKAEKLDPSDSDMLYRLGLAHERSGNFQEAAKCYRRALQAAEGEPASESPKQVGDKK